MTADDWRAEFERVKPSDEPDVLLHFARKLRNSTSAQDVATHYELLRDRENSQLYRYLRGAFAERGKPGQEFLREQLPREQDAAMKADGLTMLGAMKSPLALPMAREALTSNVADLRYRGAYVLGWLGNKQDIARLHRLLREDPDVKVRSTAAAAHFQVFHRLPQHRQALLASLHDALRNESDPTVAGWIIVEVQDILKKRFGLKENVDDGVVEGDVEQARERCMRALERANLDG
jgi:HEAT repeat protein